MNLRYLESDLPALPLVKKGEAIHETSKEDKNGIKKTKKLSRRFFCDLFFFYQLKYIKKERKQNCGFLLRSQNGSWDFVKIKCNYVE